MQAYNIVAKSEAIEIALSTNAENYCSISDIEKGEVINREIIEVKEYN